MSGGLGRTRPRETVRSFLDAYFRFHPEQASARAYPGCDELVPERTPAAIDRLRGATRTVRETIEGNTVEPGSDEATDLAVLRSLLAMATFSIDELDWPATNPLWYVEPGLDAIDAFDFREDLEELARARLKTRRLEALPRLLESMKSGLREPMQPYVDAALEMLEGFIEHLGQHVAVSDPPGELAEASASAQRAIERAHRFLDARRPESRDFEAMGEERYARLLNVDHFIGDSIASLTDLAERTRREAERGLRATLEQVAPAAETAPVPALDRGAVLDYYRVEIEAMRRAVVERQLMTIPEGAIQVVETPPHHQALLPGASYLPPPVYGQSRLGHLFIRPVPEPMDEEERLYYHDLIVNRRARNLIVHEVYPGHHLQFLHAAAHPNLVRKVRDNDVMVEGWALYCEHLMREQGLFESVPSARPWRALRFRAVRVIVDIGIHTGTLTLAQAVEYMCRELGAADRGWVETEVRRYATEPSQAMSYVVGRQRVLDLREEWRERIGERRFSLQDFHDRFLAEGSIPIALIRAKMLGALL